MPITSDLLRQQIERLSQQKKPTGQLNYQDYQPEELGTERPQTILLENQLPLIRQQGQQATLYSQTLARNKANYELMLQQKKALQSQRQGYSDALKEYDPWELQGLDEGFLSPVKKSRNDYKETATGRRYNTEVGQKVFAVADGIVAAIRPDGTIVLRNGQRYRSLYGGITSTNLKVGMKVNAGDAIGTSGGTLDFDTKKNNKFYQPEVEEFYNTMDTVPGNWRQKVVNYAKQFVGDPYVWGGESPGAFDCSGLTQYVYEHMGLSLPRVSADQGRMGKHVPVSTLKPGDLVFWDNSSRNNGADHVAIYLGNGKILEAPRPGLAVRINTMYDESNSWGISINAYRKGQ